MGVLPVRANVPATPLEPFAGHLAAKPRRGSTERCNTAPDHGASLGIALAQKPGLDSPDAPGGRSGPTQ